MSSWIPYDEGEYGVEAAFLYVSSDRGLRVTEVVVEIYDDGGGKNLRGYGQVVNALLVDLLDWGEDVDLIMALAPGHCYRLSAPVIRAGKVFAPGVRSAFHFQPRTPWTPLDNREFEHLVAGTVFLDPA
jgi:allantoicase